MTSGQLDLVDTAALVRAGQGVSATAAQRVQESHSPNTLRAYKRVAEQFATWCAEHDRQAMPADAETFGEFVSHLCDLDRSPATIQQAMAAIRTLHARGGHKDQPPTEFADAVFKGHKRMRAERGAAPPKEAPPISTDSLRAMVDTCDRSTLIGCRDHLILILGFSLMSRRSELAELRVEDITESPDGLDVLIRKSKTDQEAKGTRVAVPRGAFPGTDPVATFRLWRDALANRGITSGLLIRSVTKGGKLGRSMGTEAINDVVRRRAAQAKLPNAEAYTAHSLRAGGLTSALRAGVPIGVAARHGRWKETSPVVNKYARAEDRWRDNAMRGVL